MLNHDLTLKNNELFLVGRSTDRLGVREAGIYLRDTRFVTDIRLTLNGQPVEVLDLRRIGESEAVIHATNAVAEGSQDGVKPATIALEQRMVLNESVTMSLTVGSFSPQSAPVGLGISISSDFDDMFEVRGMPAKKTPVLDAMRVESHAGARLTARDANGEMQALAIYSNTPASDLETYVSDGRAVAEMAFQLELTRGVPVTLKLTLAPEPLGAPIRAIDAVAADGFRRALAIETDLPGLEPFIDRCDRDLALLQTSFPEGSMPAAGIPWYIAPFGRDSLIVALQTMHVYPQRVAATLRVLAALQGTRLDPFREEEPGKILHEMRYGTMARTGQIPHTPYFGSIDSNPLFVMTFAQSYLWHRDDDLYDDLIGHVQRALAWIDDYGDLDGDGLVEFGEAMGDGVHITQQGWKDSGDSLHFADGRAVQGPVALVEVQGYVFAAYAWLAEVATLRNEHAWAEDLSLRAERVRAAVEGRFWMDGEGFYAQALDGAKHQVDAISSNPGHLLFCGLPGPERAALVGQRLAQPDIMTRWGVRTLSSAMTTYNPMSYHNGSVWPHDNSLLMWGARRYGLDELALGIAERTLRLGSFGADWRLPELCCGFNAPDDSVGPVDYPVSCIPQAWAAASGHLMMRTLLGMSPDAGTDGPIFDPLLPSAAMRLRVSDVAAFGHRHRVEVVRTADGYNVDAAIVDG